jgi:ribonuclease VapC
VFVDASALVSILAGETDGEELRIKLKSTKKRIVSPMVIFEATLAIRRIKDFTPLEAFEFVSEFLKIYAIKHMPIEPRASEMAIRTFERYGKGQDPKARLNMGDCFAYACARLHKVPLLCKGDDFIHTDIELA